MSATNLLCRIIGINPGILTKEENIFLESELFMRLCEKLKEVFKQYYKEYFNLIKLNTEMENAMLEANFIRCVIDDILTSEEYTIEGIACYTQTPEEVIYDIATGNNLTPSLPLARKIIEIHRTIRPDLYASLMKKIVSDNPTLTLTSQ